jgi:hypothetical protein
MLNYYLLDIVINCDKINEAARYKATNYKEL